MTTNINEIYTEAHRDPEILAALLTKEYICCDESVKRLLRLLQLGQKISVSVDLAIQLHDNVFFDILKMLSAFQFEAGRLYGRQEIIDKTLQEIK